MSTIIGAAQLTLFGLMLAAGGGLIKVVVDIEANTSGRTSNVQVSLASAEGAVTASQALIETQIPHEVPPGYQETGDRRLRVNEQVFSRRHGEGVVVGTGRSKYFTRIRFDEDGTTLEMEAFGLYYKV